MNIESPGIPYNFADLEPAMSRDSLVFHFLRHQRVYFDRLLSLVRDTPLESLGLEELIRATEHNAAQRNVFHYAAELWNHNLFWNSMRPQGGGPAHGVSGELIDAHFGSFERFVSDFKNAASAHFGSGWLWLVWRDGELEITSTNNADSPLLHDEVAILGLDLWEHAYYLDYQNRRASYVSGFLEELANWDFANRNLARLTTDSATPERRSPLGAEAQRLGADLHRH